MPSTTKLLSNPQSGRIVFRLSLMVAAYFVLMILLSPFRMDYIIIGVVIELFTLPALLLLVALLIASIILLIRKGPGLRSFPLGSLLILISVILFMTLQK
jgi:hypothetical protein